MTDQPTTQEAEKALETLERCRDLMASGITVSPQQYRAILDDFNAALWSLRTQHTAMQTIIENQSVSWAAAEAELANAEAQSAKDREEIERLKAERNELLKYQVAAYDDVNRFQLQHTKDQERIEELEAAMQMLGERHYEFKGVCPTCKWSWPCPSGAALRSLRAARRIDEQDAARQALKPTQEHTPERDPDQIAGRDDV